MQNEKWGDISIKWGEPKEQKPKTALIDQLYKKYQIKNTQTIKSIKEIGLPTPGEQFRLITMRSFNTAAFITLIANKEVIQELILVIYSINREAAKTIIDLKNEGEIKDIKLIISSMRNPAYKAKSQSVKMFIDNGINIVFASSHAKIAAIKSGNNYYVIEGSGNMSYNSNIEQYVIDNDKAMYDFTKQWVTELNSFQ